MLRFDPKNTLILLALEAGLSSEMISSWNVVYTGVGKVNATLKGSEYVASYKPYLYLILAGGLFINCLSQALPVKAQLLLSDGIETSDQK